MVSKYLSHDLYFSLKQETGKKKCFMIRKKKISGAGKNDC